MAKMKILTKMLKQKAVYWSNPTPDGRGGSQYDQPIEMKCRWEDKQEKIVTPGGEEKVSKAVVYVESDVEVGGVLFLGLLTDLGENDEPRDNPGAFQILQFAKLPTLSAKQFLRTAWL